MTENQIREYLELAISTLCGDRIHFCTSNKAADLHRKEAKQVHAWVNSKIAKDEVKP